MPGSPKSLPKSLYASWMPFSDAYAFARSGLLLNTAATRLSGCALMALIMRVLAMPLAPIKAHWSSLLVGFMGVSSALPAGGLVAPHEARTTNRG
jgi:hypothetical protein